MPSFHIQTFGCQMNANDSDWLARSLVARGWTPALVGEADCYIINTCSVRDKPEQKVYSELGRIARFCKVHNKENVTVCVGGCVAQQVGEALVKRFPMVRLVFGTDGIAQAPEAIERLMREPRLRLNLLDFTEGYTERSDVWEGGAVPPHVFVNIMQGCDNYCAYCIVPFVRGRQKSRQPEAVLEECRSMAAQGARELTLLGQNVNSYGKDALGAGVSFAGLLEQISAIDGIERIRFMTSHPKDIADEVIEAFAHNPKICPRLHLPLQSGSDRILRLMGRRYDTEKYLRIVEALRLARPDILFSTDIIVGFPGETEEDFEATMRMMETVGYGTSFSFIYSDRPGTKATSMPDKVERSVALERLSRLQGWQTDATERYLRSLVGTRAELLLENILDKPVVLPAAADKHNTLQGTQTSVAQNPLSFWQGKTPQGLSVTVGVALPPSQDIRGKFVEAVIDASTRHALYGSQAGTLW